MYIICNILSLFSIVSLLHAVGFCATFIINGCLISNPQVLFLYVQSLIGIGSTLLSGANMHIKKIRGVSSLVDFCNLKCEVM